MPFSERLFSRTGLVAAWLFLVLIQLPIREVMPPDESRFAHQAQSMKSSGDWIVPHIADVPNVDKPPVLFWGVTIASLPLARVNETTSRIPSAIGSLIVLLLAARVGRRLFRSDLVAYGGALIALTGVEFFQKSEWCSCDMPMAAFAWTAIVLWSESAFGDPPPQRPMLAIAAGWSAVGVGILTKGPVALLWPLFFVLGEAIARRRFRPLVRIALNPGVAIMLAIVGGWLFALGQRVGWSFVYEATIHQNLDRYAHAWNSVQPWWFYVYQTPADLLPWIGFAPAAIALTLRRDDRTTASRTLAWFTLFGIAFFSKSSGKRGVYVMEAFPAISLLMAAAVIEAGIGRIGFWLMAIVGAVLGVGAPAAIAFGGFKHEAAFKAAAGMTGAVALVVGGVSLCAGAVYGLVLLRRGRKAPALASAVSGTLVAMFLVGTVGGATWSRLQGARPFCAKMDAALPANERIAVEGTKFEQFMFYTLRHTTDFNNDEELIKLLSNGTCRYAIVVRSRYEKLKDTPPISGLTLLAEAPISDKSYVLVGPAR